MTEVNINVTEIMEALPHRYPFLLVDRVIDIAEDEITAIKNVTINEEFFQGHFPGNPTMPGVLIIEALAQVGSILILKMDQFEGETAYIGGINKAKFRQKVVPGDVLKLHFEIVKLRDFVGIGKATAYVEDKKVCECELTFIVGR